jgi:hypothetical protein
MQIDAYTFGRITVNGREYTSDVIIYPGRVDPSWWRKEGHSLHPEDVSDIVKASPDVLIIGTGYFGVMKVPQETLDHLAALGIDVRTGRTGKAVELYNSLREKHGTVIAALHITC